MSRFLSESAQNLTPYVPGEQPRDRKFIKLNTNESPFPPPQSVLDAVASASARLNLYSDPVQTELRAALADYHGVQPDCVSLGNGSDENLAFIFKAFFDDTIVFPDITYGFYPVLAKFFGVPYEEIPVRADFSVHASDYTNIDKHIVIANPNAPTGLLMSNDEIETVVRSNRDKIVVVDEAYADFANQSAAKLTREYDNLIVVTTFSKSRFMAGARLGCTVANAELIADIERVRNAWNPYNINSLTLAAGVAALKENEFYRARWLEITETRGWFQNELKQLGFEVLDSRANFVFCRKPGAPGRDLYGKLRDCGFLVRSLSPERIRDWLRITVGTREDMDALIETLKTL